MPRIIQVTFCRCLSVVLILFGAVDAVVAQSDSTPLTFERVNIMNDRLSIYKPGQLRKIRKKLLKHYMPNIPLNSAIGYSGVDGSKLMFFKTTANWDSTNVIEIWDMAFSRAEAFRPYKFIQSGFENRNSSNLYFLKIWTTDEQSNVCVLLMLSELEDVILYGLYISPSDNYDVWDQTSDIMIKNQYAIKQHSGL